MDHRRDAATRAEPTTQTKPFRFGIIHRSATLRVTSQTASTFSRWTARRPFVDVCSSGAANCPPAQCTTASTRS
jgi:hypothetical protein